MKRFHLLPGVGAFLGMLVLILDSKTALEGARSGITLCLNTLIPSLFPFFLLSGYILQTLSSQKLPGLQTLAQLCGVPPQCASILIPAFLGGYPVGAQSVASAWKSGILSKEEAEHLLRFSNNAGPSFLFGMVSMLFSDVRSVWVLWIIHILSALLTTLICSPPARKTPCSVKFQFSGADVVSTAVHAMSTVCSWVILFRILLTFLNRWLLWMLPSEAQILLTGILELSNGCFALKELDNEVHRLIICSGLLAFGGICITLQTISVTKGLSLRAYFQGKLCQTIFSLTLSLGICVPFFQPLLAVALLFTFFLRRQEIRGRFPRKAIV